MVSAEITEFLNQLESFSGRKLRFPQEMGELIQSAADTNLVDEFEELVFQSKFLVRTGEIMERIGPAGEGYQKLFSEFRSGITKSINILEKLSLQSDSKIGLKFPLNTENMDAEGIGKLMGLLTDLSWIKNWQIDGNPLPYKKRTSG